MSKSNGNNRFTEAVKAKDEIAKLRSICDMQADEIERLKKAKFSFPKSAKRKPLKTFIRLIVPDTHGSIISVPAINAMFADLQQLGSPVREIVLKGDHLECGGFLAQHHTLGYVAQSEYTFADDQTAANILLDKLQELAPQAKFHYLEGNHEARIEKWIVDQVVGNAADKKYLSSLFSTSSVLSLEKRGINFYSTGKFYGVRVPGAIRLGKCYFVHGSNHGKDVARVMAGMFGGNVCFAHVHTQTSVVIRTVANGEIGAWCPGCLCNLQPLWRHSSVTHWSHGYAFQIVDAETDEFLHINVPIIDGKSLLTGLAGML
jgi:hypothetical protein